MDEVEKVIDAAIQEWGQMALRIVPVYAPLATHIASALNAAGLLADQKPDCICYGAGIQPNCLAHEPTDGGSDV